MAVSQILHLASRTTSRPRVASDQIPDTRYQIPFGVSWAVFYALLLSGCGYFTSKPQLPEAIGRIAVLPIRRDAGADNQRIVPGAERTITAHIYGVLSATPQWSYVPDLAVTQALSKLPREDDVLAQALLLGKAVNADAVLCGTLSKYIEREGSEYGARQPAAVGFELQLIAVAPGKVLWKGSFDQQQKALSENLFNWWQFWRGGVRWFSADEFSRLGVERLLDELKASAP